MNILEHFDIVGAAGVGQDPSGYRIDFIGGTSRLASPTEILAATKAFSIAYNRSECERRIFARYPAGRQLSALAGMYDTTNVQAMHDWISSMIAAENAAADLIDAATTVAEVEAVTVAWPA